MITIAPVRRRSFFPAGLNGRLLEILRQHPGVPFPCELLASMMGKTHFQIEIAIEEIEGPIESEEPGAFVHHWRITDEAIYIP
ncbi:MAG: hypothetical protein M1539_03340 [Actinobacteria bacterium]|nr:hypothetical protein [Actinomycetota bacterium]MCL5882992.1 hypothetical protein [Actinomycetota bacterium]